MYKQWSLKVLKNESQDKRERERERERLLSETAADKQGRKVWYPVSIRLFTIINSVDSIIFN